MALKVNNLSGFGSGAKEAASITHMGTSTDLVAANPVTHTGMSIGDPTPYRYIVVTVTIRDQSANRDLTSATIGGLTADILADSEPGVARVGKSWIIGAYVPTGTTATVSTTFDGSQRNQTINVYRLTGVKSSTPFDTAEDAADDGSGIYNLNTNTKPNGMLVGCAGGQGWGDCTWTGLTEDSDGAISSTWRYTSASLLATSTETPRTITADGTGTAGSATEGACCVCMEPF